MILIDTNIISEMMRPTPNKNVLLWLNQIDNTKLYISSITIAEISYGIVALAKGKRRSSIEDAFNKMLQDAFNYRILSFDEIAASWYGKIMTYRKISGKPMGILNGQIAAIARTHNAAIATRNVKDFNDCGIDVINPFE